MLVPWSIVIRDGIPKVPAPQRMKEVTRVKVAAMGSPWPGKGWGLLGQHHSHDELVVGSNNKDLDHHHLHPLLTAINDDHRRKLRLGVPNCFWCHTSARQCDVLPSAIPRHPAQVAQPPRQQPLAAAHARPAAGSTDVCRPPTTISRLCPLHQWRPPAPSRTPPSAPAAPASPPELNVPLSISTEPAHTPATTAHSRSTGITSQCYPRRISSVAAAAHEVRGEFDRTSACVL